MPNPNYMEMQKDLVWKMRGIVTDWLIQVHSRFRLLPETLFLCVNIIDRFLSARVVSLVKLQLVGITCMFITAKVEEIISPSAANFLHCADSSYSETEIFQAERYAPKTPDWNLSYPIHLGGLTKLISIYIILQEVCIEGVTKTYVYVVWEQAPERRQLICS